MVSVVGVRVVVVIDDTFVSGAVWLVLYGCWCQGEVGCCCCWFYVVWLFVLLSRLDRLLLLSLLLVALASWLLFVSLASYGYCCCVVGVVAVAV